MTQNEQKHTETNQSAKAPAYSSRTILGGLAAVGAIIAGVFWFAFHDNSKPQAPRGQSTAEEPKGNYYLLSGYHEGKPITSSDGEPVIPLIILDFPPSKFEVTTPKLKNKIYICRGNEDIIKDIINENKTGKSFKCKSIMTIRYRADEIRLAVSMQSHFDVNNDFVSSRISGYKKDCGYDPSFNEYGYNYIGRKNKCKIHELEWGFREAKDGVEDLIFVCGHLHGISNRCKVTGRLLGWRFSVTFDDRHLADWMQIYASAKQAMTQQVKYARLPNRCVGDLCE